jgi:hypothetical protein
MLPGKKMPMENRMGNLRLSKYLRWGKCFWHWRWREKKGDMMCVERGSPWEEGACSEHKGGFQHANALGAFRAKD